MRRLAYLSLAWISLAAALAGAVLPLLPATPFALLAAWAAGKGSPRLHRWLWNHPRFGPALEQWKRHGAIAGNIKWLASAMLLGSWTVLWLTGLNRPVLLALSVLFAGVAIFLWSRPAPVNNAEPG